MPTANGDWRIFVASPFDVAEERESVNPLVERLNSHLNHAQLGARLKASLAEYDVPPGGRPGGPQALIEETIPFTEFDFVLVLFWKRIGTPFGDYLSGTVREIESAYTASQRQALPPRIMVYEKCEPYYLTTVEEAEQVFLLTKYLRELRTRVWTKKFRTGEEFRNALHDDLYKLISTAAVEAIGKRSAGEHNA
jgi:hypothetical protein